MNERKKHIREIAAKMKNESYVEDLQAKGVNVEALKRDLKKKQNDNVTGISKQGL